MAWTYTPAELTAALEASGYDVDTSQANLPNGGGSLSARLDRAETTRIVTVDAGGRLKVTETIRLSESPLPARTIAGLTLHPLTEVVRTTTVVAQLADQDQFQAVLEALEDALGACEGAATQDDGLRSTTA